MLGGARTSSRPKFCSQECSHPQATVLGPWKAFHAPVPWAEVVGGADPAEVQALQEDIATSHAYMCTGLQQRGLVPLLLPGKHSYDPAWLCTGVEPSLSALNFDFYSGLMAAFELNSMSIQVGT